jgi:hypothetical protein
MRERPTAKPVGLFFYGWISVNKRNISPKPFQLGSFDGRFSENFCENLVGNFPPILL